jgi:hypothetical protein
MFSGTAKGYRAASFDERINFLSGLVSEINRKNCGQNVSTLFFKMPKYILKSRKAAFLYDRF